MPRPRSLRDIQAGLIFIGIGVAFGVAAAGYPIGTALRMGPGYFPLVLAVVLALLGVAIAAKGLATAAADGALPAPPWRAILLLSAALVFFGATVRGLGLAPSLLVTAFAGALAGRSNGVRDAALLAAFLTAACVLIFLYGLGLALPAIGPWLGG